MYPLYVKQTKSAVFNSSASAAAVPGLATDPFSILLGASKSTKEHPTTILLPSSSIRYHGSPSSIKCHVYHHVRGRRHTPAVCNRSREPHTSHYPSRPVTTKNNQQTTHTSHYHSRQVDFF